MENLSVGVAIVCRHDSKRFRGKILAEIRGRSILGVIVRRIRMHLPEIPLVVATSADKSDEVIKQACDRLGVKCFRGELNNVADRIVKCGQDNNWDYVARINGDNLLANFESLQEMLTVAKTGYFDLITNVPGRTFPTGMSVEIIRCGYLSESIRGLSSEDQENATSHIYRHGSRSKIFTYMNDRYPTARGLSLAIDTEEDLDNIRRITARTNTPIEHLRLGEITRLCRESGRVPANRCILIAEIGGNHEGNFDYAKYLCSEAIRSGADCIKFQIYAGDTLVNGKVDPNRNKHFKKFELTKEEHLELAEMCKQSGRLYTASVWDNTALDWIDPYLDFYKVGSGDLTAWPLIKELALRGKPIVISTGLATQEEVAQTVEFIRRINKKYEERAMICVLQCTSMYPIPIREANVNCMDEFRKLLDCSVGYSDHTIGREALKVAVAKGAEIVEFHFTDSREGKEFRDHAVSLTCEEVKALKEEIDLILDICGDRVKQPQPSEIKSGHIQSFRRGIYSQEVIEQGKKIERNNLVYLRPLKGTDPRDAEHLIGRHAKMQIDTLDPMVEGLNYE
jgi:sialic acid synthase SpsE/spore coat polysaccharide biosynthesis protein SpsF (cytidylyltransferase family)